ncbi:hypothetical protein, partial [Mycobacterium sp.]|uniref:hypothetical protein n=1 Tax=Mycobacterium sp. TaxID=1785 RepID=UPI003BB0D017
MACSAASRAERADAAHSAHGPADRNGVHQPSSPLTHTMRTPGPANQRATSAVSSTGAPPSGAESGSTTCAPARTASTTGIGGTPRRAVPAAASWP